MAVGAALAAGGASVLGNILSGAFNNIYEWQNRNWQSQADYEDYRADYDKAIADYFLDKQIDYNTYMSNTAYQRAVADMEAAGINPAIMQGTSAQAASVPNASVGSRSGAATNARMNLAPFGSSESVFKSLLDACLTNSRDARRIAGKELLDNARHDHKMEEINESYSLKKALTRDSNAQQHLNRLKEMDKDQKFKKDLTQSKSLESLSKADYYDERARSIRHNRGW